MAGERTQGRKGPRTQKRAAAAFPAPSEPDRLLLEERAARAAAEQAERRFAFLAEVSHALSASLDPHETLSSLARLTVPEIADSCVIDIFDDAGKPRRVVTVHLDPVQQARLEELRRDYPPDLSASTGMGQVLRTGQAHLFHEVEERDMRAIARSERHLELLRALRPRATVMVPMLSRGRILGAIALSVSRPGRDYGPVDLALAEELGNRAALAVDNARLYEETQKALAAAEAAGRRASFLSEASTVLSSSLDYTTTLTTVARLAVPRLADWCTVDLVESDGALRRLAVEHVDPAKVELAYELHRYHPEDLRDSRGLGDVLRSGQPMFLPDIPEEQLLRGVKDERHREILEALRFRSGMIVPLISRGRTLGVLTFVNAESGRRCTREDLDLALDLARRAATAVDNSLLYQEAQEALRHRDASMDALRGSVEELAAADRRKDEFLAMLAHELRNPLAAISNAGYVLDRLRSEDRRAAELVAVIARQIRHLSRLVDDLLDVSRFTRGKIELRMARVELRPIVEGAVETARPLIERLRHELKVDLPAEPLWLQADATRIEQVLANLLNNAAKFTDPGGRIELSARREGDDAVLRVRDNGAGIAPELLPTVFDLFVQDDRSLARSHGGLGIGLTLVRSLVAKHGGTVEARSEGLGHGSELTVRLPLIPAPETRAHDAGEPATAAGARRPSRILLVEDNVDAAEALAELLRLWGHEVEVAHDGATAVPFARLHRPDVVLLDIGLPGMDGYQVAGALRALPDLAGTLLIALTGYGQPSDRQRSLAAGFDHHLVKPVDLEDLQRLVGAERSAERAKVLQEETILDDRQRRERP
jgi:signal transduction histidine kinase/FixJ family two-component response regulator